MAIEQIVAWVVGGGLVTVLSGATILWNNITNTKAMRKELIELRAEVLELRAENKALKSQIAELTTRTRALCDHYEKT